MVALIKITVEGETKIHAFSEDAERAACGYAVVDYCESLDGVSDVQSFTGTWMPEEREAAQAKNNPKLKEHYKRMTL